MMEEFAAWLERAVATPEFAAAVILAIIGLVLSWIRPQARISWGISHGFTFTVPQKEGSAVTIHTGSVVVANSSRTSGTNIEVHFQYKPAHIQVWPSFDYKTEINPEGIFILSIPNLGKRESITIELISTNGEIPAVVRVRSPLGESKRVTVAPMRVWPAWFIKLLLLLMIVGAFTLLNWLLSLIVGLGQQP